jgi:pyruvate formate lyase activating enzyme
LQPVLDSIINAYELGMWVEVVTLVIPEYNDSNEELWDAARFISSVSADIPWHVTAFHPDYKHEAPATSVAILQRAADIGQEAGLHYVYAGNLPGKVGSLEDTFCPKCTTRLIQRRGYTILDYKITSDGKCPNCNTPIAGVWTEKPDSVKLRGIGVPRRV